MGFLSFVLFIHDMKRPLVAMVSLTCIFVICGIQTILTEWLKRIISINVWAGIIGDRLLERVLLPQRLNGETYLAFLQNMLPPLLENVPMAVRPSASPLPH